MLPKIYTCALAAISLISSFDTVFAGHARFHHVLHPRISSQKLARRAATGQESSIEKRAVSVTINDLQMLQSETAAFHGWINDWLNSSKALDVATASSQLSQEFTAYQGWIKAWIDSAMGPAPAPPPPSSTIPVTITSSPAAVNLALPSTTLSVSVTPSSLSSVITSSPKPDSVETAKSSPSSAAEQGAQFFESPSSLSPEISTSSATTSSMSSSSSAVPLLPTTSSTDTPTASAAPLSTKQVTGSSSDGSFDPGSSSNVAVYYGQSAATSQYSLEQVCQSDSVDIVVLAFLTDFFGPGGLPKINFGSACGGQPTTKMAAMGATGLMHCQTMQEQIQSCQNSGKKVLLSLGGALATSSFPSDDQATKFAGTLVDLFAGGTGLDSGLRPFGSVKLDGFDIDNEDHSTASYSTFVSALRKNLDADSSKKYFISAAPQCPRPDASIPLDAMKNMDFIFVQFYNNPSCNVGSSGFVDSLKAWSSDLGSGPKLYVGMPGCSECAGSGYLDAGSMASTLASAKSAGISNLGGVSLWDGPMSMANGDYTGAVKKAIA